MGKLCAVECFVLVALKEIHTCCSVFAREGKLTEKHLALGAEDDEVCDGPQFLGEFIPQLQAALQEICLLHR